jgi:DHA1 family bicyclomycin/chloramphenicol resistance-like MFS transporter
MTTETRPLERIPIRMLLIVGSLTGFGPLCIDMYLPALPRISRDLHTSASAVQLSLTACLIGLAFGQLIIGPISDRLGRRKPLFFGLTAFVVASLVCTFSPDITTLIALRFVQGFGGAAGLVISQAIVRDQYSGTIAARFFSLLILVTGLGPILAPQIGAELLRLGSWRIMFVTLAAIGTALIITAAFLLPETLAVGDRISGGLGNTLRSMKVVVTHRSFLANALSCGFAFGVIFAYIAGSSFVLENVYGLSPQMFSLVFALNAVGLITASQINGHFVGRLGSSRLLGIGLTLLSTGGVSLLILVATDSGGLAAVIACMFISMTAVGFIGPNSAALAMNDFPQSAGSAAAVLGLLQFVIGAGLAPVVGLGGTHDALPMAIVMASSSVLAIVVRLVLMPRRGGVIAGVHAEPANRREVLLTDPLGGESIEVDLVACENAT